MSNKNADKIRKGLIALLNQCDDRVLELIQPALGEIVQQTRQALAGQDSQIQRREERVQTSLEGTLIRLTDLRPGEPREFPVKIKNISAHGMCLQMDERFIPSRLMRVTFVAPKGKVMEREIEICWLKKIGSEDQPVHLTGCRTVTPEQSRRLIQQDEKLIHILHRLHKKRDIRLLVLGPDTPAAKRLLEAIRQMGFPLVYKTDILHTCNHIEQHHAEVLIFTDWLSVCQNALYVDKINRSCPDLPKIALLTNQESATPHLRSGIDECLDEPTNKKEILNALERALTQRIYGAGSQCRFVDKKAALLCLPAPFAKILTCYLENCDFYAPSVSSLDPKALNDSQINFVQFEPGQEDTLLLLRRKYPEVPLIACCDNVSHGQTARQSGAHDYLCPPPKEQDVLRILQKYHQAPQSSA